MPAERILILGGTRAARELAAALISKGYDTVTSLAGVTASPILPPGTLRRGGFGGVDGLVEFVRREAIAAIADATHPFAAQMSAHAHAAAGVARIPCLRLELPPWTAGPADRWISVRTIAEAVDFLPEGARVLAAVGGKDIATIFSRPGLSGVARMVEAPAAAVPTGWRLLLNRPPFTLEDERTLLRQNQITHVLAKNSGNSSSFAKFVAAREAGLPVVLIERPFKPDVLASETIVEFVKLLHEALLP